MELRYVERLVYAGVGIVSPLLVLQYHNGTEWVDVPTVKEG
jgi:hypothetical protein